MYGEASGATQGYSRHVHALSVRRRGTARSRRCDHQSTWGDKAKRQKSEVSRRPGTSHDDAIELLLELLAELFATSIDNLDSGDPKLPNSRGQERRPQPTRLYQSQLHAWRNNP